jgi:hypothetical protein
MKFYSGFTLENEEIFFDKYINRSRYTICGFSYGAIKAIEDVKEHLRDLKRVDTLQLFSPAFFQNRDEKFKKMQILGFTKNRDLYIDNFIKASFYPYPLKNVEHNEDGIDDLKELLFYEWNKQELQEIAQRGVKIEVYLGEKDKVIDANAAREFFLPLSTVTYIKDANHFLEARF